MRHINTNGLRHVDDAERRARLARRQGVSPELRLPDVLTATRAMTVLHATEAPSVYLSLLARVDDVTVADVDRALYADRTLVKQLAMRRTMFAFPRELLPAAWGSASARVARQQEVRLVRDVVQAGLADDGAAWLADARAAVLEALAEEDLTAAELRERVPALAGRVEVSPGKPYGGSFPIGGRVLTQLGAEAQIVRGSNAAHWRVSRFRFSTTARWLGEAPVPLGEEEGYAELVRGWLATFGPGTTADLQWWLGATVTAVRRALADVGAVAVSLDNATGPGTTTGWVLPDDLDPVPAPEPWVALLPVLDPTIMGWQGRGFYLGGHGPQLFDSNGNAGATAWWDGRVVGGWVTDEQARIRVVLLEDVPATVRAALDAEAARLTDWLGGVRVGTVYPSPLMRAASGGPVPTPG